jgi:GNAT superfamily N-acetyltransferase
MSDPAPRPTPDIRELHGPQLQLAYAAMSELRGHRPPLASPDRWQAHVTGHPDGYRVLGAFVPGEAQARAVLGFRVMETLAWGRMLYVDDLSTRSSARRQGHAQALLQAAEAIARELGCEQLELDSGVQRFPAHRLYLRAGFDISSHHFSRTLTRPGNGAGS